MTSARIREIKKRKGTQLSVEFIINFEKDWDETVGMIMRSGVDLSRIILSEEQNSRQT